MEINDNQILKQIRDMGALGHTPAQIAALLRIPHTGRDAFLDEFTRPETKVYESYANGKAMMDYNTNVELARAAEKGDVEAVTKLDERKQEQKAIELMADLFGI